MSDLGKNDCHCGRDGHALHSVNCPIHGPKPLVAVAHDKMGNVFEAYVLRRPGGGEIRVDVLLADRLGGIRAIRDAISPYYDIVCELLI